MANDFKAMEKNQGGLCKICQQPEKEGTRLCVDHDHKTGRIRGLLCRRCNRTLGLAKDDVSVLFAMVQYLERNRI